MASPACRGGCRGRRAARLDALGQPLLHPAQPSRRGGDLRGPNTCGLFALCNTPGGARQALRGSTGLCRLRRPAAPRADRAPDVLRHLRRAAPSLQSAEGRRRQRQAIAGGRPHRSATRRGPMRREGCEGGLPVRFCFACTPPNTLANTLANTLPNTLHEENMLNVFVASGLRTPFSKVDDALAAYDAIALSVPVAQAMVAR